MFSHFGIDNSGALINPSLCPSISLNSKSNLFVISYYIGENFCQQHFAFDGFIFEKAWGLSHGDSSLTFDVLFFDMNYSNANSFVKDIFAFFSITPSLLHKVAHMRKNLKRKVKLIPKFAKIKKELGFINHRKRGYSDSVGDVSSLSSFDIEEINRCSHNMRLAVSLAAKSFDLSFFPMWKEAYIDLLKANGHLNSSRFYEKKLFKIFSSLVDKHQKML